MSTAGVGTIANPLPNVDPDMVREYDGADDRERDELWELKRAFELGIGSKTGGEDKQTAYKGKLDDDYRRAWLEWVDRCVEENPGCVQVVPADAEGEGSAGSAGHDSRVLRGYVFVLPESMRFVWDAAVLNEIYVRPGARGTGVADGLMDAALETALDMDLPLDRMVLDVDRENPRAQRFYEKWGFDHWGEMVARDL